MTQEEILQLLCTTCPHNHAPADAATWLMEACVANSVNKHLGTDYEPSSNCREQGVDLISRSGLHAPVQVKTAKGDRQDGKAKRKTIVSKALTGAHKYGHKKALLATARFVGGKLDKLVVDDVKKLRDLNRGGFSFKQLREWGFEELVLD
jgi:hypothetical protein